MAASETDETGERAPNQKLSNMDRLVQDRVIE